MSETKQMTLDRAREIALEIGHYKARTRKLEIDPTSEGYFERMARKFDITVEDAKTYFLRVMLQGSVGTITSGRLGGLQGIQDYSELSICKRVALKILQAIEVSLDPRNSREWIAKLSKETRVSENEIEELYIRFVIPVIIAKIMGWKECHITTN